jgi:membrane-bound lytic murein transglycosylase A
MHVSRLLIALSLLLFLPSCADKLVLKKSSFAKLDGWQDDDQNKALMAFLKSCNKFDAMPEDKKLHMSGIGGTYHNWKDACDKAKDVAIQNNAEAAKQFFEANFTPYLATNRGNAKSRLTGYYEMDLKGSSHRHGPYQYPIYKTPFDLVPGQQYYSREEIDNGALAGKGLELAWVDDPVRAFFLHIQGSGRINMEDGSVMRVGYDGKNGQAYKPIGRMMADTGLIDKDTISAQSIKRWLYAHPDKARSIMDTNPSYVFFRNIASEDGPIGAQGVALTPMRSLAVDKKFLPYGAPIWVNVELNGATKETSAFKKLLIAQDTGGAIKGPGRGDLFFGYGAEAEELAGYQNNLGQCYILLPSDMKI